MNNITERTFKVDGKLGVNNPITGNTRKYALFDSAGQQILPFNYSGFGAYETDDGIVYVGSIQKKGTYEYDYYFIYITKGNLH